MDAQHLPGFGLDGAAVQTLVHQGQGAVGVVAEDDADPVEFDGVAIIAALHAQHPVQAGWRRPRSHMPGF